MASLHAYFDDSGTHDGAGFTVVAGAVANLTSWKAIESQWSAVLKKDHVAVFRSSLANSRQGDFEGWDDERRNGFTEKLLRVISKEKSIRPISVAVRNEPFNEVIRDFPDLGMSAYQYCCEWAALGIGFGISKKKKEKPIAVSFEAGQRIKSPYLRKGQSGTEHSLYLQLLGIGAVDFVPEKTIPLQVADLFAYEVYKAFNDNPDPSNPQNRRYTMLQLLERLRGSNAHRGQTSERWIGMLALEKDQIKVGLEVIHNNYALANFKARDWLEGSPLARWSDPARTKQLEPKGPIL